MVEICNGYFFEQDKKTKSFTLVYKEVRNKMEFGTMKELEEKVTKNRTVGYYANIEQVVKAAADDIVARKVDDGTITNIREYLDEYKSAVKMLTDAINGNDKQ